MFKINTKIFHLFLITLSLSSCTIVHNLDEILTLQNYSHEKEDQHRLVKSIDDRYDALDKIIDQGHISDYKDKDSFEKSFGEPILKKDMGDGSERWLYRHAIFKLSKTKVYVYFDRNGQVIKWEKLPCSLSS